MASNIPVDHGWAWMIALGCCGMYSLVIGTRKTVGIFFVEFIEKYNSSRTDTVWIAALLGFLMFSMGPFANALCDRFSTRAVVTVGAILSAVGFLLSGFATQLWHLYITFGVFIGVGFGLSYAPSIVILGRYFNKRRALANGLAGSGGGLGGFVVPFVVRLSINEYGLQGALFVMTGIILNLVVVAALYRSLDFYDKTEEKASVEMRDHSVLNTGTGEVSSGLTVDTSKVYRTASCSEMPRVREDLQYNIDRHQVSLSFTNVYTGISDRQEYRSQLPVLLTASMQLNETGQQLNGQKGISDGNSLSQNTGCYCNTCCKLMFDWSLLRDPVLLILLTAASLGMGGYPTILLMYPPHMDDLNFSKQDVVIVLSVSNVLDFVGRISIGWVTDQVPVKRYVYATCLLACSLATLIVLFSASYAAMMVSFCLYGFFGGAYMSLFAVILADEMGMQALSVTLGLSVFCQALLQLIVNPIIGVIRDDTGSWLGSFVLSGVLCFVAGLLILFIPCVRRCRSDLPSKGVVKTPVIQVNDSNVDEGDQMQD